MEIIEVKAGHPVPMYLWVSKHSKVIFEEDSLLVEFPEIDTDVAQKFLVAEVDSLGRVPRDVPILWLKKGSAFPVVLP